MYEQVLIVTPERKYELKLIKAEAYPLEIREKSGAIYGSRKYAPEETSVLSVYQIFASPIIRFKKINSPVEETFETSVVSGTIFYRLANMR